MTVRLIRSRSTGNDQGPIQSNSISFPRHHKRERNKYNWAGPWENVSYAICEQQRRRLACASAQSDQRLCFRCQDRMIPLVYISEISRLQLVSVAEQVSLCLARSETPEDTFSHGVAQLRRHKIKAARAESQMDSSFPTRWLSWIAQPLYNFKHTIAWRLLSCDK